MDELDNLDDSETEQINVDKMNTQSNLTSSTTSMFSKTSKRLAPIVIKGIDKKYTTNDEYMERYLTSLGLHEKIHSFKTDRTNEKNLLLFPINESAIEAIMARKFVEGETKVNLNSDKYKPAVIIKGASYRYLTNHFNQLKE
jgi:hypothetical protein